MTLSVLVFDKRSLASTPDAKPNRPSFDLSSHVMTFDDKHFQTQPYGLSTFRTVRATHSLHRPQTMGWHVWQGSPLQSETGWIEHHGPESQ